mgnify:CR=1 FL=1
MNIYRVTLLEGGEFPFYIAEGKPRNIYYFSTYLEALHNGALFAKRAAAKIAGERDRKLFSIKRYKIGTGQIAHSLNSYNDNGLMPATVLSPDTIIDNEVDLTPTEKKIYQQYLSTGFAKPISKQR